MDATFYDKRVAEKNPTGDNPEMKALVDRIERWCHLRDGDRILDFGCYDGYILRKLASRWKISGVGVDLSPAAIERAEDLAQGTGLKFIVSDGNPLPFTDESFDVVVCSEILEHVPDLAEVLKEVARVLAPGGRLYATMPNSLRDVWRPFHPLCRRTDTIEGHMRRMSTSEFSSAVAVHGLAPTHVRYRGFILSAIWYRALIYTPRMKALGMKAVGTARSRRQRLAKTLAFAGMYVYIYGDRPFSKYRRSLSIDAVFTRAVRQPTRSTQ